MTVQSKMTNLEDSYNTIKRIAFAKYNLFTINEQNQILMKLKEKNEGNINSVRALDVISNLEMLIQVLENRDILSSQNISEMLSIYHVLKLDEEHLKAHRQLLNFERKCFSRPSLYETKVIDDKKANVAKLHITDSSKFEKMFLNQSKSQGKLPDEVINVVATQIGQTWKSLARYLKVVPESSIDSIEGDKTICSNETRARLVLAEYEKKIDPIEKEMRLLKALKAARRTDIYDQVNTIFLRPQVFK